ncbi:MAG: alpha/beta hydrolase fold domain-containing protein [Armatimonadota bacterium]
MPAEVTDMVDQQHGAEKPAPDLRDVRYGPYERNVVDFWRADADGPRPLVVFFHGGGFRQGDKAGVPPALLAECLGGGISVASGNYRLSDQAPFPAPMLDGARAIQFLRSKADEWELDPAKIAACGGSAGAGISLWTAFHDDMADPESDDPVERQSTRLACAASFNGQCSYDPRFIKQHIGGSGELHDALVSFYALAPEELDTPKAHTLYDEAAAITYLTADDPPVFLFYTFAMTDVPMAADADPGHVIHHPQFGVVLKERMEGLGIECVLRLAEDYDCAPEELGQRGFRDAARFFVERLAGE